MDKENHIIIYPCPKCKSNNTASVLNGERSCFYCGNLFKGKPKAINQLTGAAEDVPQVHKAVLIFYEWCVKNNQALSNQGLDVSGCLKQWEDSLYG